MTRAPPLNVCSSPLPLSPHPLLRGPPLPSGGGRQLRGSRPTSRHEKPGLTPAERSGKSDFARRRRSRVTRTPVYVCSSFPPAFRCPPGAEGDWEEPSYIPPRKPKRLKGDQTTKYVPRTTLAHDAALVAILAGERTGALQCPPSPICPLKQIE